MRAITHKQGTQNTRAHTHVWGVASCLVRMICCVAVRAGEYTCARVSAGVPFTIVRPGQLTTDPAVGFVEVHALALPYVAWFMLHVACCMVYVACCMVYVSCCMVYVSCCMLRDACRLRPSVPARSRLASDWQEHGRSICGAVTVSAAEPRRPVWRENDARRPRASSCAPATPARSTGTARRSRAGGREPLRD